MNEKSIYNFSISLTVHLMNSKRELSRQFSDDGLFGISSFDQKEVRRCINPRIGLGP